MQANQQQFWCLALPGTRQPSVLRRTLRWVGWQTIVLAFILLDIAGLGFTLVAPVWLAPWMTINVTALMLGALSCSEDRRLRRESATARERQAGKVRVAEQRNLEERQREALRQQQAERLRQAEQLIEAERRQRQEEEEREAQKRLQAALRQAQEQLREAEQRRYEENKERETQRQLSEQAERLRQAEQQRREAEQRRRQAEEEREAQRQRQRWRKRAATQFQTDWWIVLGVAPSASKDEIVRKYRHKIKQCHPDRVVGVAPEFLHLAEEQTKALNGAYANALRARRYAPWNGAPARDSGGACKHASTGAR
jgi:DnaJ-domain-containing protein 1